jgi:branched-chain amino acid transport system substrate-binding protein
MIDFKKLAYGALGVAVTAAFNVFGTTSSAVAAENPKPIPIGVIAPLTGGGGQFGPDMVKAIELAADQVNKAGPPMGRKLVLHIEDGETSPDAGVRAAHKLIGVNQVKAILGTWASGVTLAVAPLTIQAGIIEMNTSGSDKINQLHSKGLVWRFQPEAKRTGAAVAAAVKKEGWTTVVSAARDDPSGVSTVEDFNGAFEKDGGKLLLTLKYAPGQPSYTDVIRKIAKAKPQVVFTSTYAPELTVLVKDAMTANLSLNWIAPGWAVTKDFINAVGEKAANGVWAVDSAPNMGTPAYERFMTEFTKSAGHTLLPSDTYVFSSYDMVNVLALAMVDCKCDDGQGISKSILKITNPPGVEVSNYADGAKALAESKKINYQGASSNLDFNEKGNQIPLFGVYQVTNGKVALKDTFHIK